METPELRAIVDQLNQRFFLNSINIYCILFTGRSGATFSDDKKVHAFYAGDRFGGNIYLFDDALDMNHENLPFVIFHEMTHQLEDEHNEVFDAAHRMFRGTASQDEYHTFLRSLFTNLELKLAEKRIDLNVLHPDIREAIRERDAKRRRDARLSALKDQLKALIGWGS